MDDAPPRYITESWNGLPHYACQACGYDTMLLTRMETHLATCKVPLPVDEAVPPPSDPSEEAPGFLSDAPEEALVEDDAALEPAEGEV